MSVHAVLSPSASARWIACPGSVAVNLDTGGGTSSIWAREGTAAHNLLETCLLLSAEPKDFIGKYADETKEFLVTEEMADAVEYATDYIRELRKSNPKLRIYPESRVKMSELLSLEDGVCEGTSDVIAEDGHVCISVDYKHGVNYVEVRENPQLMLYAAGARARLGKAFFKYKIVIIQPRVYGNNGRLVREYSFTDRELTEWLMKVVKPAAISALQPNAPRKAGDHCKYCAGKGTCREFARQAANVAAIEFAPIAGKGGDTVKITVPQEMTPEEIAACLDKKHLLQEWLKALDNAALTMLEGGTKIPGYEIGHSKARRIFKNEDDLREVLLEAGIDEDEFAPRIFVSPAQAEDLLKGHDLFPKKKRGMDRPPTIIDPFIDYSIPNKAVVPSNRATTGSEFSELQ